MRLKAFWYLLLIPAVAFALPSGQKVTSGDASFDSSKPDTMIVHAPHRSIIEYKQFNLAEHETVQFIQPDSSSTVLNRVVGSDPSSIHGQLKANGKLFLVNPNGIYFGPNAQVNVGSLVASTLDIANQNFLKDDFDFHLDPTGNKGEITNHGNIAATAEGAIVFLAPTVRNTGVIRAKAGKVLFGSGEKATLDFSGDGLIRFSVEGDLENAVIEHLGTIDTENGDVHLRMNVAGKAISDVVNSDNILEGEKLVEENGCIRILSSSTITAKNLTIEGEKVQHEGTIQTQADLSIVANDKVSILENNGAPCILQSGKNFKVQAENIELVAFQPDSKIMSGHDMIWVSPNPISADAHFVCGHDFAFLRPDGSEGDFQSFYDPIISATSSVRFNAYTGVSLKVESLNRIRITGAVNITGPDLTAPAGDSDSATLQNTACLILRSGLPALEGFGAPVPPNQSIGSTTFRSQTQTQNRIQLRGGSITTAGGPVILADGGNNTRVIIPLVINTSGGDVTFTGRINSQGGARDLTINAGTGTITCNGVIGDVNQFGNLTFDAANINLNDIGDTSQGANGITQITATNNITFSGSNYRINSQTYTANNFIMDAGTATSFISSGDPITFAGGTVQLSNNTDLSVSTANGIISLGDVTATSLENITLNALGADVTLGAVGSSLGEVNSTSITGNNLILQGEIFTESITLNPGLSHSILLNGGIHTNDSAIAFSRPVVLQGATQIDSGPGTGNISFSDTVNGSFDLTLTGGMGNITLSSAAGAISRLGTLHITAAQNINTVDLTVASLLQSNSSGTATYTGLIDTNTPAGIDWTGTNFIRSGAINTTNSGPFTITNSGTLTVNAGSTTTLDGPYLQNGSGPVNFTGDFTTTSGNITFTSPVTAVGNLTFNTGTGPGNLTFLSTVEGTTTGVENITITSGTGNVVFSNTVGATTRLGPIQINNATNVTTKAITSASFIQGGGLGATTFNGPINTNTATGIQINGNAININDTITTTSGGVTLTNSALATIAAGANMNLDGAFIQNGSGNVSTQADITTSNQNITITSPLTLADNVALSTSAGAGNILFLDTIDGAHDLTLDAGAGNITFTNAVGNTTRLAALQINGVQDLLAGALTLGSFVQTAGSGTSSFNGPINTNAAEGINWTGTNFTRTDSIVTTNSGPLVVNNSGTLDVTSALSTTLDGFYNQTGTGPVLISGSMTTTNDDITFAGPVTLTNTLTLNSGVGAGSINFNNTVNATTANVENLTLIAGTGDVALNAPVGDSTALGTVQVTSASNVTLAALTANNLTQVAGSGTTTLNGAINTNGISLTGSAFTINNNITTALGGALTINNSSLLTLFPTANLFLDGIFVQSGSGAVNMSDSLLTSNDDITFAGAITLMGDSSVNSGSGSGDILFNSTIDGAFDLTVNAGAGDITFADVVGSTTRLGTLQINGATNITSGAIAAGEISCSSILGTASFNGALDTNTAAGIDISGNLINFNSPITTTNGGEFSLSNLSLATLSAAADMNLTGPFIQNGPGNISTAADITTTNQNISFASPVTLTGNLSLDTGLAAGNILFSSEINGGFDLTLASGTGNTTISSAVGGVTRLGTLQIDSVQDFSAQALTVGSIMQNAGAGTSSYNGPIDTNGVGGINWTGNNFNRFDTVVTTNTGPFIINNSGTLNVVSGISTTLDGFYNQTGSGNVFFSGSMTTTNDDISFNGPVNLTGALTLNSGTGAGNIIFNNTVNGTTAGAENLTLIAGTGNITLNATVGGTTRLGIVDVQSATNVEFNAFNTNAIIQSAGTGTTTFNGVGNTNTATGIDLTGSAFTINAPLSTTNSGPVLINNGSTLTMGVNGDIQSAASFSQTGAGTISTAGDITTTNANLVFQNPITLTGDVALDTGAGAGNITLNDTVNGPFCLSTTSGAGSVNFNGAVGNITPLDCMDITGAIIVQNVPFTTTGTVDLTGFVHVGANITTSGSDITITGNVLRNTTNTLEISTGAGTGDITITGTVNSDGAGRDLTLTAGTGSVTVGGTIGGAVALNDLSISGNIIDLADIGSAGLGVVNTLTLNATDTIEYNGTNYSANTQSHTATNFFDVNATSPVTFTSTNTDIVFNTGVIRLLDGNTDLNMNSNGGNITIDDLLASLQQDVTINASTGTVTVAQMGTNPGDLDIVTLTGDVVNHPDPIFANSLIINSASVTTLSADFFSASPIIFNEDVVIANTPLTISTCPGGADITFNGRIDADLTSNTRNLIIDACGGNIVFNGPVGSVERLTSLTIQNFNNLDANNTITVGALTQTNGTGTSTYAGAINTNAIGGISWQGNIINRNGAITTTNGGTFTINNSGLLVISGGTATSLDGAYSQTGTGPVQFGGSMLTSNDSISFNSPVTLTGAVSLNTGAGAGDITFSDTINGAHDLILTSGTGTITLTGAVGNTTRIGTLTIDSVATLNANEITSNSIVQNSGTVASTFNGPINTNGPNGVALTAATLTINDTVTTTGTGGVTLTHTGLLTLGANGDIITSGPFLQSGGGTITTSGDITTTSQNILFTDAVTLGGPISLNTGGASVGNITFSSTVDGAFDLTLQSGSGNITFNDEVGGTTRIGNLQVSSTNNWTTQAITASSVVQLAGTGTTTFNGALNTDGAGGLNWTGNNFNRLNTVVTSNGGPFLVDNSGVLNVASAFGSSLDGPYSQTGSGPVLFGGTMTTTNDSISFDGPVTLTSNLTLDSGTGAGDITFSNTIDGSFDLTLTAGTGNITLSSPIGATTRLGAVQISSAQNINTADLTVASLLQSNSSGTATYTGLIDTSTAAGIDWTGTNFVRSGAINTSNSGSFTINNAGTLTVNAGSATTLDGPYLQNGSGPVNFTGDFTTTNDDITFTSPVTATGNLTFNTAAGGGNITFLSSVEGTTAGSENITITAGTGNVTFSNTIGATTRLGDIGINSANNLTTQAITAASLVIGGAAGTATFNGSLNTNAAAGIQFSGNSVNINDTVTTTNGGLTLTNGALATIAAGANMNLGGAFVQDGAGNVSMAADITTTNQNITFTSPLTLAANVALSTSAGAGNILFLDTIDGAHDLTLDAGAGNITFTNAVGNTTRLAALQIDGVQDLLAGALTLGSFVQTAGSGTSSFNGPINTNAAGGINWTGTNFTRTDSIVTTNSGPFIVDNSGTLDVTSALSTNLDGFYNQTGSGPVLFSGSMTTTNDNITIAGPVTLTNPLTLNSGIGAGSITFNNTINGTTANVENLTLVAGTGDIALNAAIGSSTALGTVQITSANNVTIANLNSNNLTQVAGTGTTSLTGIINTNGISLTGSAFIISNNINTALGGALTINNSSLLTLAPTASISLDGPFNQSGSGTVNMSDSLLTSNDDISFAGAITLTGDSNVNSGFGIGDILFSNTIDGAFDLTVNAGAGDITFSNAIGGTTRLNTLQINGATNVAASTVNAAGVGYTSVLGTATFNGTLNTNTSAGIDISGNLLNFNDQITTTNGGGVTLSNLGLLTLASAADMNLSGPFIQNGPGGVFTAADVTTTNQNITFASPVTLTGNLSLDTGTALGNIVFSSEVNGGFDLTLASGTGNITISGAIGGATRLGRLQIDSVQDFSAQALTVSSILQNAGTGTSSFNGPMNTSGAGGISWTGTNFNRFDTIVTTNSGPLIINNSGTLTVVSGISTTLDGFYNQTGSGPVFFSGTLTTTNDNISFNGPVTLTGPLTLDSGSGAGDITFNNTVNGNENLTLDAGTGNITFSSPVGDTARIRTMDVQNATNISLATVTAASIDLSTTNEISLNGAVNTNGNGGIALTGNSIQVQAPIVTSNTGRFTLNSSTPIALASPASINIDGPFSTTGGVDLSLGIDITANSSISITGPLTLTEPVNLVSSGDILLLSSLDPTTSAVESLTLTAGSGDISISGPVGNSQRMGDIVINSAFDVSLPSTIAKSLTQLAGTGTTTFNGIVNTNDATGVNLTGANFELFDDFTLIGSGPLDITNSATLTIPTGVDLNLGGAFNQDGTGPVIIGMNLVTNNQPIHFSGMITLSNPLSLDSGAGGGNITLYGTVNGSHNLTAAAGTGDILFTGAMGGTTRIGEFTINSATNATVGSVSASTITQNGITNTSSFTGALNTDAAGGIILNGAVVNFTGSATTNSGPFTITNSGLLTLTPTASSLSGPFTQNGAGPVTLGGNIQTTNQNITFQQPITLQNSSNLNTGSGIGDITFQSTIQGDGTLALQAGTGNIIFSSDLGVGSALGGLTITGANQVQFDGTEYQGTSLDLPGATQILFNAGADTALTTTGPFSIDSQVQLSSGTNLSIQTNGGSAMVSGIQGSNNETLDIQAGGGTISIGNIGLGDNISTVNAEGGNILLTGEIHASELQLTANQGDILNQGNAFLIQTTGNAVFLSVNQIGTFESAIQVDASNQIFCGTSFLANFNGSSVDNTVHIFSSPEMLRATVGGSPCILIFNGIYLADCRSMPIHINANESIVQLDRRLFYVPGIYAEWNNLGSKWYFREYPPTEQTIKPRTAPLYQEKKPHATDHGQKLPERSLTGRPRKTH
ncbi:MAG: filamentous hemagglutinin N-terminal domain-containing protein [Simkaniaceae bacterium]|nr:filamentous hemagglutinin N-terminal domain-containing protein [Candidatus Sacchlamyda saccharinae]